MLECTLDTRPSLSVVLPREDSNGSVSRDVVSKVGLAVMSCDKLACDKLVCYLIYFANDDWSTVNHIEVTF